MAPTGALFLLLTLLELRRQGLTYLALYALMRTIQVAERPDTGYGFDALRNETGLESYEVSRACALLWTSELVQIRRAGEDGRKKILVPTKRGRQILNRILSTAADRLWSGTPHAGRIRRVKETAELLRRANDTLLGSLQLSFFDKDLFEKNSKRKGVKTAETKSLLSKRPGAAKSKASSGKPTQHWRGVNQVDGPS